MALAPTAAAARIGFLLEHMWQCSGQLFVVRCACSAVRVSAHNAGRALGCSLRACCARARCLAAPCAELRRGCVRAPGEDTLLGAGEGKLPGHALALSMARVWEAIREQRDLNLPAHKVPAAPRAPAASPGEAGSRCCRAARLPADAPGPPPARPQGPAALLVPRVGRGGGAAAATLCASEQSPCLHARRVAPAPQFTAQAVSRGGARARQRRSRCLARGTGVRRACKGAPLTRGRARRRARR